MNKVILLGNITKAIELRHTPSGAAVAKTGIACNRKWKDKTTGEQKEEVMFIDLVIWGKSAEIANQYMTKGKKVLVEGALELETWNDQEGNKRSKHTVKVESFEFVDSKGGSSEEEESEPQPRQKKERPNINIDEEIPF